MKEELARASESIRGLRGDLDAVSRERDALAASEERARTRATSLGVVAMNQKRALDDAGKTIKGLEAKVRGQASDLIDVRRQLKETK